MLILALTLACVDAVDLPPLPAAAVDADRDGWAVTEDCDDANPARNPGQVERCNGLDDDCDSVTDDDAIDRARWFADVDLDGFGDATDAIASCTALADRVRVAGDCDDARAEAFPGAEERCNGLDDDCDLAVDDGTPPTAWYPDEDHDSYGAGTPTVACDGPAGWTATIGDCAPADGTIHPDAIEVCDGVDQDCDDVADDDAADASPWFFDADGDGHGDPATRVALCADPDDARVTVGDDCDDADAAVFPGAPEVCDDADQDCDEEVDDDPIDGDPWYVDGDADGWGDGGAILACTPVAGRAQVDGDCDDTDPDVSPDAEEVDDDGVDQDCDGDDPSGVDWAGIASPCADTTADVGDTFTSAADVYRAGATDDVGCSGVLTAALGLGPTGTDPATASGWTWTAATCTADADHAAFGDGSLDRFTAAVALTDAGDVAVAWRFRYGATWVYADLGEACGEAGTTDGAADWPTLAVSDPDADDDGFDAGDDCDDTDPDVNPDAPEDPTNGVDDDCDGDTDEYVLIDDISVGDLVISEIMLDPAMVADEAGEWIELYNASADPIDVDGLVITSLAGTSTETETVSTTGVYVLPGGYLVLGRTTDTTANGGAPVAWGWGTKTSDLGLKNSGTDPIGLENASGVIDELTYDLSGGSAWPTRSAGKAFALKGTALDATSNDSGGNWCRASTSFGDGDLGTPGEENDC